MQQLIQNGRYSVSVHQLHMNPFPHTRGICLGSMASSAKRRAVGKGENPADSEDNSSDEGLENDGDSGENDSGSEEEINEVR